MRLNDNFQKMPGNYLFTEVAQKVKEWERNHLGEKPIRLGIGDVTLPIPEAASSAMACASIELGNHLMFRGYGPEQGYSFLREAICREDYHSRGIEMKEDEIFVSDGIKSECGEILELFDRDNVVGLCDPVYPAYIDAAVITGRAGEYSDATGRWSKLRYLPCTEESSFLPQLPKERIDLLYLCFPNNPTGVAATKGYLAKWVDWANESDAVLLFDGAYERFISNPTLPRSIYEINGAKTCAIEFRSFSKTAGFTGVRCGYTVIPSALKRSGSSLQKIWKRRLAARSNGVSYIVQRGAEAIYSEDGKKQVMERTAYYRQNAIEICTGLRRFGFTVYGGENAPYVWVKTPGGMSSWTFFDLLLNECGIITTPGVGFGPYGEGYLRLTAFGKHEDTQLALSRIEQLIR